MNKKNICKKELLLKINGKNLNANEVSFNYGIYHSTSNTLFGFYTFCQLILNEILILYCSVIMKVEKYLILFCYFYFLNALF